MDLQFVQIKWCLKLFIILDLFVNKLNSVTLNDLKEICCIDSGSVELTKIGDASPYCSAIATFSGNSKTTMHNIEMLQGSMPIVYIHDNHGFKKMSSYIKSKHVQKFLDELKSVINQNNITVMIFDHFDKDSKWKNGGKKRGFQVNLQDFFQKLKAMFPGKLFGLSIPTDESDLNRAFDRTVIDSVIDVYLVKTINYNKCKRHDHQDHMANVDPSQRMETTLKMLMMNGYDLSKCLLDIRVIIHAVDDKNYNPKNDRSYTNYCSKELHKDKTRICANTLLEFYAKGSLVYNYHMAGYLMQSLDRDDFGAACGCGHFPVAQCLDAGAKGLPQPKITHCTTWALTPSARANMPPQDDVDAVENDGGSQVGAEPPVSPNSLKPGGDPKDDNE